MSFPWTGKWWCIISTLGRQKIYSFELPHNIATNHTGVNAHHCTIRWPTNMTWWVPTYFCQIVQMGNGARKGCDNSTSRIEGDVLGESKVADEIDQQPALRPRTSRWNRKWLSPPYPPLCRIRKSIHEVAYSYILFQSLFLNISFQCSHSETNLKCIHQH